MKLAKSLLTASALSLFMLGNVGAADAPRNLQPLFGNFLADTDPGDGSPFNAGIEMAVPLFDFVDNVAPIGYPEKVLISYKIYAIGTNTPALYATPVKTILTPALDGCLEGSIQFLDWNLLFSRRGGQLNRSGVPVDESIRVHLGINMEMECYDSIAQRIVLRDAAGVYSANLSGAAAGGTTWAKGFVDKKVLGLNGVDTDNDYVTDRVAITTVSASGSNTNATVIGVIGLTGAVVFSKVYPLVR